MKDNKFTIEDSEIQNPRSKIQNPQRGFTLIEIAMVLVVIGILLSIGVGMLGTLSKRAKYNEAKDIVKSAREAVYGYAVKNGFLPATDVSLAGARALDPWGRALEYRVATELSGSGKNACGVSTTGITVIECTIADCTASNTKSNIAFIVYSKGEDADGACTGTASPFKIWEQYTGYNSPCTYAATNAAHQYDDIVQYVTLDEIRYLRSCPQALAIAGTAFTTGVEDTFYSYSMQATGGLPPYTWSGTIGSGLSLGSSGLISGVINVNALTNTGELTTGCSATLTVPNTITVTDSAVPVSTVTFGGGTIPVNPQPLNITTPSLRDGQTTVAYSAQLQGTGGKNNSYTWSVIAGALPAGITLSSGGLLSGTPTTAGTYNFTITLSDTCTTTAKAFTLNVAAPIATSNPTCTLSANPTSVSSGQASVLTWAINNGPADGAFSPTSGTCSSFTSSNAGSCTTAALAATTSFVLTVTNANGTASCAATVTVTAASCTGFSGWISSLPNATNCSAPAYTGSTTVSGGVSPYSWSFTATPEGLPSGISFCTGNTAATCTVSGTPLASPGTYSFTPQATDSCASPQTTSQAFSITVNADSCYAAGMQVRNESGATRYWWNGAVCTSWTTGNYMSSNILPAGSEVIYTNSACTTQYCATPITYCQQKPYDTAGDNDCKTQMTGACVYADR